MIFLLFAFFQSGFAYDATPEFLSLTEEEQETIDRPNLLEPEYQSDLLAYRKPFRWNADYIQSRKATDLSIGSVSAKHFKMDSRLKVHQDLTDSWEIRLTYVDERDLERNNRHFILETVFWLWKFLGVSLYGEPALFKRENDTGLALLLRPQPRHEIRFFNTFVDVTRLQRNDRNDTYVVPFEPAVRGMVGRFWNAQAEFLEIAARWETKTVWRFNDDLYDTTYWRGMASVFAAKRIAQRMTFFRLQWDRRFEGRAPFPSGSGVAAEAWNRDRLFLTAEVLFSGWGPKKDWELKPGIEFAHRHWKGTDGQVLWNQVLPYVWWSIPSFRRGVDRDLLEIGLDATIHRASGPMEVRNPLDEDERQDFRLNLVYRFQFQKNAELRLLASADLDRFGSNRTWQGGNGQLRLRF